MAWNEPGNNGKDPWSQRKNDQGPPDLDDLVKKMQDKLGGLFGGGGGGKSSGNGEAQLPPLKTIGALLLVALLVWLAFGFYTIQPAERGVVMLFGKYTKTTTQGLNWYFPHPVGKVHKVNVEEVRAFPHRALMLTQDENIVSVELEVQYNVMDAPNYLFNVRTPDNTLREATESALREVVGTTRMDDVLTVGRAEASIRTRTLVQEMMDRYQTGLNVRSVNMQNAQPPEAVQASFADVIKAREDEERHKNTAEAYANEAIQKAGGDADRMRQEAEGYKAQVVAHAEGEARRFESIMGAYHNAPEVTRTRLYLETVEDVFASTSKILMDVNSSNALMYLPLDKIIGQSANVVDANAPMPFVRPNPDASQADDRALDRSRTPRRTR
jgi:modulator of FtsH protease HflK